RPLLRNSQTDYLVRSGFVDHRRRWRLVNVRRRRWWWLVDVRDGNARWLINHRGSRSRRYEYRWIRSPEAVVDAACRCFALGVTLDRVVGAANVPSRAPAHTFRRRAASFRTRLAPRFLRAVRDILVERVRVVLTTLR